MKTLYLLPLAFVLITLGCNNDSIRHSDITSEMSESNDNTETQEQETIEGFDEYWNQGMAEMTSYELIQGRYGEERPGKAVLIYVTEPFSRSKQVKLDDAGAAGNDKIDVLKLNMSRKFNTGIYPYSLMSSIFTPYKEYSLKSTVKLTTSVQEWCGHEFVQLNKSKAGYDFKSFSYFESGGDQDFELKDVLLEQELWNLIRIKPKDIPVGQVELVPAMEFIRFKHIDTKSYSASISINKNEDGLMVLEVDYSDIKRNLKISFQEEFPYEIESWEETYESGWGDGKKMITSTGKKIERRMIDYWSKNSTEFDYLRGEFGLE